MVGCVIRFDSTRCLSVVILRGVLHVVSNLVSGDFSSVLVVSSPRPNTYKMVLWPGTGILAVKMARGYLRI